jgi:hypothetical protein
MLASSGEEARSMSLEPRDRDDDLDTFSPNATVNAAGRMTPAQQRSGGGDSAKMVIEEGRAAGVLEEVPLWLFSAIELAWLREREEEIIAYLKDREPNAQKMQRLHAPR